MIKIFWAIVFSTFLVFGCIQNISGQIENDLSKNKTDVENEFYSTESLEYDYQQADVVVYVNVKERKLVDFIGKPDCENNKGTGYCLYLLTAEVKKVFKGDVKTQTLEFYVSPDADYPKERLMGEKVVFLNWSDNYPDRKMSLGEIENSTRTVEHNVLEKMRKIVKKTRKN